MAERRLPPHPSQIIDRSKPISFEYEGRRVSGYEGDTVASAMYASGIDIFGRSFKYHQPQGPAVHVWSVSELHDERGRNAERPGLCMRCSGCGEGHGAERLALCGKRRVISPATFRPVDARGLLLQDACAAQGSVAPGRAGYPSGGGARHGGHEPGAGHRVRARQRLYTDVAVIGGGSAGMSAALAAAGTGARVASN